MCFSSHYQFESLRVVVLGFANVLCGIEHATSVDAWQRRNNTLCEMEFPNSRRTCRASLCRHHFSRSFSLYQAYCSRKRDARLIRMRLRGLSHFSRANADRILVTRAARASFRAKVHLTRIVGVVFPHECKIFHAISTKKLQDVTSCVCKNEEATSSNDG